MARALVATARKACAGVVLLGAPIALGLTLTGQGDPRKSPYYCDLADKIGMKLLHRLDPEDAHDAAIKLLEAGFGPIEPKLKARPRLKTEVFGRTFSSPLGLAAGFDKQGKVVPALAKMGFGYVEVGGVTPLPQPGNPRPRLFRLAEDGALINRFGLNSDGAQKVAQRLILAAAAAQAEDSEAGDAEAEARARAGGVGAGSAAAGGVGGASSGGCGVGGCVVGVNLAKNTLSGDATADYVQGVLTLGPHVDVVKIHI